MCGYKYSFTVAYMLNEIHFYMLFDISYKHT